MITYLITTLNLKITINTLSKLSGLFLLFINGALFIYFLFIRYFHSLRELKVREKLND